LTALLGFGAPHFGSQSKNEEFSTVECPLQGKPDGWTKTNFLSPADAGAAKISVVEIIAAHLTQIPLPGCSVAPASRAARMWRRAPSWFRFVPAELIATAVSSTNIRERNLPVQGLRLIDF